MFVHLFRTRNGLCWFVGASQVALVVKNPPTNAGDIRYFVQEDNTYLGATKPVSHHSRAHSLAPVPCNKGNHCNEKPSGSNEDLAQSKMKNFFKNTGVLGKLDPGICREETQGQSAPSGTEPSQCSCTERERSRPPGSTS